MPSLRTTCKNLANQCQHLALFFPLIIAGCCPQIPPVKSTIYYGPTESMQAVVRAINENNARIPTLWTQLNYTAQLVDPEKKTTDIVSGDGGLMYARPMSLLLNGNKDIAGQVFQLGSNQSEFWCKIRSSANSYNYWWGHYANLGKPCCKPIPIRPDLVLHVLGVGVYGADFLRQPVPVMRFDNDHDVYVFDLNAAGSLSWQTLEEVWYDRTTKRPVRVILYGEEGRVLLRADLSDHTPVETTGMPKEQWPEIARHYELLFPDSQSRISFDFLNTPQLQHLNTRHFPIPNANTFERVLPDDNNKVIQIDKDCGDAASAMLGSRQ